MRVLVLGAGANIASENHSVWLAEKAGKILVERFVEACDALDATLIFAVREEDIRRHSVDSVIRIAAPNAHVVAISGETLGAPCTALLCSHLIPDDEELLILNGNEFLDVDYGRVVRTFRDRKLDGGVVCFRSLHPRYSYMLTEEDDLIIEASEKRPISRHATAGFYWFKNASDFVSATQDMIRKDVQIDGRFYVSLTFNELILQQRRLGLFEVDPKLYLPLKSRQQVLAYEAGAGDEL